MCLRLAGCLWLGRWLGGQAAGWLVEWVAGLPAGPKIPSLPLALLPPGVQVRVLFGVLSLEMWAVGQGAAYHLHLPRLYGRVVPKKCSVKVNQASELRGVVWLQ